jgi:cytochrome c-type biogenesis protein CcmF
MTEAGINSGLWRDLYVSLGENLGGGDWSMRVYYKPFMAWVWLAGTFMTLGGLLAVTDRRYRTLKRKKRMAAGNQSEAAPKLATENS